MHPVELWLGLSRTRWRVCHAYLGLDFDALPQQDRELSNVFESMLVSRVVVGGINFRGRILHEVNER